jgi:pyochelin synthetase
LSQEKWMHLVSCAKDRACTPTALVLTVFALVIRNYSRQPNFCFNLTLFNRPDVHPEMERLIGDFTSLILFEVEQTKAKATFSSLLQQIQQRLVADLDNGLYDGINVQRDLRRLMILKKCWAIYH